MSPHPALDHVAIIPGSLFMKRQRAQRVASGNPMLDRISGGGLCRGELSEWGVPHGRGGRELVIKMLAYAQMQGTLGLLLWIRPHDDMDVYPPAWEARGIDLARTYFACSGKVLHDLKAAFVEPVFDALILDTPGQLTGDDLAYLATRARDNHNLILLLRPYLLRSENGNVWARLRLNCWYDAHRQQHVVRAVKGSRKGNGEEGIGKREEGE